MKRLSNTIVCAISAALMVAAGCGKPKQETVSLGEASLERRAEFVAAVAAAIEDFEDLESQGVQIAVSNIEGGQEVTVRGGHLPPSALENALGVALTNMSFKYPGLGFMAIGDGGWRILMPNEIKIPSTGDFGLSFR